MIIDYGFIVAAGLLFLFYRLNWKMRCWVLSHPLTMDISIFFALFLLHSGTYSGVMVATVGSLICQALITIGRKVYGFISIDPVTKHRLYQPGFFTIDTDNLK